MQNLYSEKKTYKEMINKMEMYEVPSLSDLLKTSNKRIKKLLVMIDQLKEEIKELKDDKQRRFNRL